MHHVPPLADLGRRIMVIGPTNAGKSTLADAISRKLHIPPVHIDLFSHLPDTDWVPRPIPEFHALHDAAILADAWVMDGNYTAIMPQRLARATGIVMIDDHFLRRYVRYVRRTLLERDRIGSVAGGKDSVKWEMLTWIWKTRDASKYRKMALGSGVPAVICPTLEALEALYAAWNLDRRRPN